tara:strand:+ start:130 stop:852 length:723 start_codon:yes stop_codon:yes gene_type:complete
LNCKHKKLFLSNYDSFEFLFKKLVNVNSNYPFIALTGGSTIKSFYNWIAENKSINKLKHYTWTVGDERSVPLDNINSNLGQAIKYFLSSIKPNHANLFPIYDEYLSEKSNLDRINKYFDDCYNEKKYLFDLCILSLSSQDSHIASIFPNSSIINSSDLFETILDKNYGKRITITPKGLSACKEIIVLAMGKDKKQALLNSFKKKITVKDIPSQLINSLNSKVTWLIEEEFKNTEGIGVYD